MKILQIHNRYFTGLGGEDTVLAEELDLLRSYGHCVDQLIVQTRPEDIQGAVNQARTGISAIWSLAGYRKTRQAIRVTAPDLIHVHNTFPLLSPSVYWAAKRDRVPVVQTMHNYRLTCANGLLMRDSGPCQDCVGRFPLSALRHRCYKRSLAGTVSMVALQQINRSIGTYSHQVDAYIVLTNFAKDILLKAGLPEGKVFVKPNFILPPEKSLESLVPRRNQITFVGKIVREKGVDLLLKAWSGMPSHQWQLHIIGDGPEKASLESQTSGDASIVWHGWLKRPEIIQKLTGSRFLVMASRWYEGLPMVLLEAFATSTPVIVPNLGAFPELVTTYGNGLVFEFGSAPAFSKALTYAISMKEVEWQEKSQAALIAYNKLYTPDANYKQLEAIYQFAQAHSRAKNT